MSSIFSKLLAGTAYAIDRSIGWHHLPRPLGILTLAGPRTRLRERNLYDTGLPPASDDLVGRARDPAWTSARTIDCTLNDLGQPLMGSIGTRFGRNVPADQTWPEQPAEIFEPNPRLVSRELLTREEFIPATTLNVLAAALHWPLEVFHAPGHSPGHLVFYWSERRALFAGDAIATWPEVSAGWRAFNLSLRRMADFDSEIVAVGHGEPIRSNARRHVRDLTDALERNS